MQNESRLLIVITSLLVFLCGVFSNADAQIPTIERDALIALYTSTHGENWTHNTGWKEGEDFAAIGTEGTWYGITLNAGGTGVEEIELDNNNLTGEIPLELTNLSNLRKLIVWRNQLTGNIPSNLGNLTNLEEIYAANNGLTGAIPPELGNLSSLESLNLHDNQLEGSIPGALGSLSNLRLLLLSSNQLSGAIPPELGSLASVQTLQLNGNQLTGGIPSELGSLSNLRSLVLSDNQLDGSIPSEIGNLSNLTNLSIKYNQLTGSIPPELGNLGNLRYLYLHGNELTGSIPIQLGSLSSLIDLRLYQNQLQGQIPSELGALSNLEKLLISFNELEGSIPSELENLTNLNQLALNGNKLGGEIPAGLTKLTGLTSSSSIIYNALYTNNETLQTFLNTLDSDWEGTQTVAPGGVYATPLSIGSIEVSWTPIAYTEDSGGYRVLYSTSSGGPYTSLSGTTADKSASQIEVTGLNPDTTYHFVVQTRTDPHGKNSNTVDSEYSAEAMATTFPLPSVSGRVTISIAGHNDLAVTNATVTLEGTAYTTTTDSNGDFTIEGIPPDTYTLVVTSPALVPVKQEISLSSGQDLELTPMMTVYTKGDLTGDGITDLADAVYILQVTCGEREEQ